MTRGSYSGMLLGVVVSFACGAKVQVSPALGVSNGGSSATGGALSSSAGSAPEAMSGASGQPALGAFGGASGGGSAGAGASVGAAGGADANGGSAGGVALGGAAGAPPLLPPVPPAHRSCLALAARCGPASTDCCAANFIPGGIFSGFYRTQPTTVSDFRLENFEVTAERFRAYAAAYPRTPPAEHAGKNPRDPNDLGWDASWNTNLPADGGALTRDINARCYTYSTLSDTPNPNDLKPVNCTTWYEAQAFCIWEGGRLPTIAEWEYATRGGDEERRYAWGNDISGDIHGYANVRDGCESRPNDVRCVGAARIDLVGSTSPRGDSKWGQSDLIGNLWEWTSELPVQAHSGIGHVIRGGGFEYDLGDGLDAEQEASVYTPLHGIGFRCAFDVEKSVP